MLYLFIVRYHCRHFFQCSDAPTRVIGFVGFAIHAALTSYLCGWALSPHSTAHQYIGTGLSENHLAINQPAAKILNLPIKKEFRFIKHRRTLFCVQFLTIFLHSSVSVKNSPAAGLFPIPANLFFQLPRQGHISLLEMGQNLLLHIARSLPQLYSNIIHQMRLLLCT